MKNKISVIISVYNNSSHLLKCLSSLNNQSLLPDEVILTDDGSAEDIKSILTEHIPAYHFKLIFCQQADLGFRLSRCKNNGIRLAVNEIVLFLDQDIITSRNYLLLVAQNIKPDNFVVSLPVRTNSDQLAALTLEKIKSFEYEDIITVRQFKKLRRQYRKESLYSLLHKFHLRKNGIKMRGGCFGTYKENLIKVNGFDENFVSWGNEDDDLGKRLSNISLKGFYLFQKEYSIHLYHPENHDGSRKNKCYYNQNKEKYSKGYYFCEYGLNNPKGDDKVKVEVLRP